MPTLLEVLDSLKGQGVADIDIENFLKTTPSQWKEQIHKNLSASVDPTTAVHRASLNQLKELYESKTKRADMKAFDEMQALSTELGDNKDVLYKHDQYQATVTACVIALN